MRHIPEDELHAYLDQGLSRTQCVEIESHLADCPSCQAMRDGIAALRDRTTALLSRLSPPRASVLPSFESLRVRAAAAASQRRRRLNLAAWAASLVAAVGIGWTASALLRNPGQAARTTVATAPAPAPRIPQRVAAVESPAERPLTNRPAPASADRAVKRPTERDTERDVATRGRAPRAGNTNDPSPLIVSTDSARAASQAAALAVLDPKPALELTGLEPADRHGLELNGMWRTMSWDGAKAEAGERVPHIDGLPVVQVQIQNAEGASRPVMVVAQQLASGQVIRTIEGPASDVTQMLSRRGMADVDSLFLPGDSGVFGGTDHAMAMQVGDRMLAITGNLPPDSLRAMIRRLNAEMRTK